MTNVFYRPDVALHKIQMMLQLEMRELKKQLDAALKTRNSLEISFALGQLENVRSALMRVQVMIVGGAV